MPCNDGHNGARDHRCFTRSSRENLKHLYSAHACVICPEETEILEYNYLRSESLADNPPFWFLMAHRRHSMRMVKTSPVPQILESSLPAWNIPAYFSCRDHPGSAVSHFAYAGDAPWGTGMEDYPQITLNACNCIPIFPSPPGKLHMRALNTDV